MKVVHHARPESIHPTQFRSGRAGKILVIVLFVGLLVAFFAFGGAHYLSLEALQAHRAWLLSYTAHHYGRMLTLAMLIYVLAVALSLPGALVLSLATGFLFGRWIGMLMIVSSATLGATLLFLGARYLFRSAAQRRLRGKAKGLMAAFRNNAFHYLLFMRLTPVFPFWLVNLAAALAPIRLRTYVMATFIGILPSSFVSASFGQSLGRIQSMHDLYSPGILITLGLLGVLALLPALIKKFQASPSQPHKDV